MGAKVCDVLEHDLRWGLLTDSLEQRRCPLRQRQRLGRAPAPGLPDLDGGPVGGAILFRRR